jgi:hypothetical protein
LKQFPRSGSGPAIRMWPFSAGCAHIVKKNI